MATDHNTSTELKFAVCGFRNSYKFGSDLLVPVQQPSNCTGCGINYIAEHNVNTSSNFLFHVISCTLSACTQKLHRNLPKVPEVHNGTFIFSRHNFNGSCTFRFMFFLHFRHRLKFSKSASDSKRQNALIRLILLNLAY